MASAFANDLLKRPQAHFSFVHTLNSGDLNGATACFARDACLITPDATAIHGRDRIRPVLAQLIARRSEIRVESCNVVIAGEVALARERWTIRSIGVEGSRFEQTLSPTLVLRRIDERWKLMIVAPWCDAE
ncbi:MAG TPA: nuclear transport factor 2 family protein [Solirubrobacterales bacterium]